jgi:AcrR family transcriptional regulator
MQAFGSAGVSRAQSEPSVPAGGLPAGRHSLTREVVLASQRGRLLDAMAQAVSEHGYGAVTVAQVVAGAGVSRKTFYEQFRDKEDCFLSLYDTGIAYVLGRIEETLRTEPGDQSPPARLGTGMRAFLAVLSEEPAFSKAIILEVHAAGARALLRRRATLEAFAQRYEDINTEARAANPSVPALDHDIAIALVAAIVELAGIRIADGRAETLPELADPLTEFVGRHVVPRP